MSNRIITLRAFRQDDQDRMLDILTDDTVKQTYMLPDFENREAAIPLFNRLVALSTDAERFVRCIALGETAIGFLNDVEIRNGKIELGYVIHPDSQGNGHMTMALRIAIHELFQLGYQEVICGAFEENKASQRVMEKAGMVRLSKTEELEYRGATHLCVYYGKRNEEPTC